MAYTSHGHHIPGTAKGKERPPMVARCGGVTWCKVCMAEAAASPLSEQYKPRHMKEK